jgi:hypothetical protein
LSKLSSGTLLRTLKHYGSPQAWAADPEAGKVLSRWGGALLATEKIEWLRASAASSVGIRVGDWEQRSIQDRSGRHRPDRTSSSQMAATESPQGAEKAAISTPQHPASKDQITPFEVGSFPTHRSCGGLTWSR